MPGPQPCPLPRRLARIPNERPRPPHAHHQFDETTATADASLLADSLFVSPSRAGPYVQGDATYLSLARSLPTHLLAINSLLAHMRSDPSRPSFRSSIRKACRSSQKHSLQLEELMLKHMV